MQNIHEKPIHMDTAAEILNEFLFDANPGETLHVTKLDHDSVSLVTDNGSNGPFGYSNLSPIDESIADDSITNDHIPHPVLNEFGQEIFEMDRVIHHLVQNLVDHGWVVFNALHNTSLDLVSLDLPQDRWIEFCNSAICETNHEFLSFIEKHCAQNLFIIDLNNAGDDQTIGNNTPMYFWFVSVQIPLLYFAYFEQKILEML